MLTQKDAEKLGWTFTVDGEEGHAEKVVDEEVVNSLDVHSGIPLYTLIKEVAALEGEPIDVDESGNHIQVTSEFVKKVSGETYEDDREE